MNVVKIVIDPVSTIAWFLTFSHKCVKHGKHDNFIYKNKTTTMMRELPTEGTESKRFSFTVNSKRYNHTAPHSIKNNFDTFPIPPELNVFSTRRWKLFFVHPSFPQNNNIFKIVVLQYFSRLHLQHYWFSKIQISENKIHLFHFIY